MERYRCSLKLICIPCYLYNEMLIFFRVLMCKMVIIFTVAFVKNKWNNCILIYMAHKKHVLNIGFSIHFFSSFSILCDKKKILQAFSILLSKWKFSSLVLIYFFSLFSYHKMQTSFMDIFICVSNVILRGVTWQYNFKYWSSECLGW